MKRLTASHAPCGDARRTFADPLKFGSSPFAVDGDAQAYDRPVSQTLMEFAKSGSALKTLRLSQVLKSKLFKTARKPGTVCGSGAESGASDLHHSSSRLAAHDKILRSYLALYLTNEPSLIVTGIEMSQNISIFCQASEEVWPMPQRVFHHRKTCSNPVSSTHNYPIARNVTCAPGVNRQELETLEQEAVKPLRFRDEAETRSRIA